MMEDLFNKKIKAKLDDLNKPVSGNVWSKIEQQIEKPWWLLLWKKYAWPVYASLATGLLWYTFYQNTLISKDLSKLNSKFSVLENQKTNVNTVYHIDTIYIEKTIYLKSSNTIESDKKKEKVFEEYVAELKNEFSEYINRVENVFVKPSLENISKNNKDQISELKEIVESSNQKLKETIEEQPKLTEKLQQKIDSLLIPERKKETVADETQDKKIKIPHFDTRLGLTTSYSLANSFGIGPVFELFMNDALSFDIGANFLNYPELEFSGYKSFNQATGKDFLKLYGSELPVNDLIEEIKIKTTTLELPISLNYYLPLKNNLHLKFMYGTHVDLQNYQTIALEVHSGNEESYVKINSKSKNSNLHNMVLGTGLQYQKNNYVFQLTPTFTYNFREVDYQKAGGVLSLKGGIFLNLKNRK